MSTDPQDLPANPWGEPIDLAKERAPASPAALVGGLERWVTDWFVPSFEAWRQIPQCWAEHGAMVNELGTAMELRATSEAVTAGDTTAKAKAMADWCDYRGRMMERLKETPGAACAKGDHCEPMTWDRAASVERRREIRRRNAG